MKTLFKILGCLLVLPVLLAGCGGGGGGGSSSSSAPPGSLEVGGDGASLTQSVDNGGIATSANFTNAVDINESSEVIGFAEATLGDPFVATFWTVDADADGGAVITQRELSPIAGTFSAAFALDDAGVAVGQSENGAGDFVAVLWPAASSTPTALLGLPGGGDSKAFGISTDGTLIVGEAIDAALSPRAVIWVADAGDFTAVVPQVLPVGVFAVGGDLSTFSAANGVARNGANEILVVGEAEAGDGTLHAALWRSTNNGGSFTASSLGADHIAYAVNSGRQVVGESDTTLSPVLWTVSDLGVAGAPVSLAAAGSAVAINENARIAGWTGATPNAAVWNGLVPATLFNTASQAYGLNNEIQPLVVGREGNFAFVKRVN